MLREARAAKGPHRRKPRETVAVNFWQGLVMGRGLTSPISPHNHHNEHSSGRKKAHKQKLFALINVQMALGQTAGCPKVNRAKKFMCSPRNRGNINFSLWLTSGLSQGCPDLQKVYVFKVYVPFSCPNSHLFPYQPHASPENPYPPPALEWVPKDSAEQAITRKFGG